MFLCAAGVQRKWGIAIRGGRAAGRAAGRNAEAVSAAPRREGAGNRSITGNKRRQVFLQASESAAGALRSAQADRLSGAAGRRLVVSKALAQQKGLAIKKAALLFTKPDGRIRNIILFPPSRREMLKDRTERTGMSA